MVEEALGHVCDTVVPPMQEGPIVDKTAKKLGWQRYKALRPAVLVSTLRYRSNSSDVDKKRGPWKHISDF